MIFNNDEILANNNNNCPPVLVECSLGDRNKELINVGLTGNEFHFKLS